MPITSHEQETRESFGPQVCIAQSLATYRPSLFPMGPTSDFEKRFLVLEKIYIDENGLTFFTPSIRDRIAARITKLSERNKIAALSREQLEQIQDEISQETRQIGEAIIERSNSLRLARQLTPEEVAKELKDPDRGFKQHIEEDNKYSPFTHKQWEIYEGVNNNYLLVVPQEKSLQQFQVVDLDDLFEQDPNFLKEQITRYHELGGLRFIVNNITYNLAIHSVNLRTLTPRFLLQLSESPELRSKEVGSLSTFLQFMAKLDQDSGAYRVKTYLNDLSAVSQPLPDDRNCFFDDLIEHLVECSGGSHATREYALAICNAFHQIKSLDKTTVINEDQSHLEIFNNPLLFTEPFINDAEQRIKSELAKDQAIATFVEDTKDIKDPQVFLQELKDRLPETFALIERFKEWLGDFFDRNNLEEFVRLSSSDLRMTLEKLTPEVIRKIIDKNLYMVSATVIGKFEGVTKDYRGASIYDPELRNMLTLWIIKATQASLIDNRSTDQLRQRQLQHLGDVTETLTATCQKDVEHAESRLIDLQSRREQMSKFLAETGISEETLMALIDSVQTNKDKEGAWGERWDFRSFQLAFCILYLSNQGLIDVNSVPLRSLVKEIFPEFNLRTLDSISQ